MLAVGTRIRVPLRELHFEFTRSSGPGGQNVNKVATKAVLRWQVQRTTSLPADVRERFCERYKRRITTQGELVMSSQRFRDQGRNVADCLEKLRQMLGEVATRPKPRRATKPGRGARERRLREKRLRSQTKGRRGRVGGDD